MGYFARERQDGVEGCVLVRAVFLRLLGLIYAVAFLSLWSQIEGLAGRDGILPVAEFLEVAGQRLGDLAWLRLPTLCWINASDGMLHLLCGGGAGLALLLVVGIAPALVLSGLWLFYLSLVVACRDFLSFQWDMLLLETGFLAIFLAPLHLGAKMVWAERPSRLVLWLLRWLLFRLVFSSGLVKLLSGDSAWRSLRALDFHYETQPLPAWTSWYVHQLPEWAQTASVAAVFALELVVPFAIFAPRRIRLAGCALLALLQVLIAATGNYGFFNLLTLALCVLLLDDRALVKLRVFPILGSGAGARIRNRVSAISGEWQNSFGRLRGLLPSPRPWPLWVLAPLAAVVVLLSAIQMCHTARISGGWMTPLAQVHSLASPFRLVNGYGLFAVMTTSRPEIVVEGSVDGKAWKAYEFRWKAGDPRRAPSFVQPHMPRLDWQMWFAALGTYRDRPWFLSFIVRLLQGSPAVEDLLAVNPFPGQPPRYVRALIYDYRFADRDEKGRGVWWKRRLKGTYCPPVSLR